MSAKSVASSALTVVASVLCITLVMHPTLVSGASMMPTLHDKDVLITSPLAHAQDSSKGDDASKNSRKLVKKVDPVYPRDLRNRNIGGRVKLNVKIAASGNVENVSIVGGNPILADSAA